MASGNKTQMLSVQGMICISCQQKIERKLRKTAGIQSAAVNYASGTATVTYDADMISLKDIVSVINGLGYRASEDMPSSAGRRLLIGVIFIILALSVLLQQFDIGSLLASAFPLAEAGTSYGMLFIIGLLTSLHCVAMCGGINLSQCIPRGAGKAGGERRSALLPSFLYNLGRVISYTALGGIVGALGSVISLSGGFRGIVQLIAGMFMVVMGVNMLGIFPWLRRLTPRMPKAIAGKLEAEKSVSKSPFYVGLLNGLMPCGPLQAMQLYALSSGSLWKGALSMLLFSLGTVPLMFGLGAFSAVLSQKFTRKVTTVGAILVVVLGVSMASSGWSLSGLPLSGRTPDAPPPQSDSEQTQGVQVIHSKLSGGRYPAITVQVGREVRWVIDAPPGSINGCNNRMQIPAFGIEYEFKTGENVIVFTPQKTGKFPYSCWMGMIRSSITVVEAGTPGV